MIGPRKHHQVVLTTGLALVLFVPLSACATQGSTSGDDASASAATSAAAAPVTKTLSDGVPLAAGAELVEAAKPVSNDRASGWSAVSLAPATATLTAIVTELGTSLTQAGWVNKATGTEGEGFAISATKTVGAKQQWLNINVTTVVPGSGPAVTYRFATAQAPTRSSSPGVTP